MKDYSDGIADKLTSKLTYEFEEVVGIEDVRQNSSCVYLKGISEILG